MGNYLNFQQEMFILPNIYFTNLYSTVSISEDVSESIVPWWAHTYSAERVPMETIVAIEDAIPARYCHDFCLNVLHCPKTSLQSRHSSSAQLTKNPGWRCFHRCWAISNKTGTGIPAKSTRQGQTPPPDQRSLPPFFINLFESGEIHQHGNISVSICSTSLNTTIMLYFASEMLIIRKGYLHNLIVILKERNAREVKWREQI